MPSKVVTPPLVSLTAQSCPGQWPPGGLDIMRLMVRICRPSLRQSRVQHLRTQVGPGPFPGGPPPGNFDSIEARQPADNIPASSFPPLPSRTAKQTSHGAHTPRRPVAPPLRIGVSDHSSSARGVASAPVPGVPQAAPFLLSEVPGRSSSASLVVAFLPGVLSSDGPGDPVLLVCRRFRSTQVIVPVGRGVPAVLVHPRFLPKHACISLLSHRCTWETL